MMNTFTGIDSLCEFLRCLPLDTMIQSMCESPPPFVQVEGEQDRYEWLEISLRVPRGLTGVAFGEYLRRKIDDRVEFHVMMHEAWCAGAEGRPHEAAREALQYGSQYGQDGPVSYLRVTRTPISASELEALAK